MKRLDECRASRGRDPGLGPGAPQGPRGANSAEPMEMSAVAEERAGAKPERKVLYYRNPMGLPDTSVPKKDPPGISTFPFSASTKAVTTAIPCRSVRGRSSAAGCARRRSPRGRCPGIRRAASSTMRRCSPPSRSASTAISRICLSTRPARRSKRQPFPLLQPRRSSWLADLLVAMRDGGSRDMAAYIQKLRNLGVPESRIRAVRESKDNPRTLDRGRRRPPATSRRRAWSTASSWKPTTNCSASPTIHACG